jgi:glycosyltransferase involved in cell wall biosynthesis
VSPPRRVAHLLQPTVGGVPRVVVQLAQEGKRLGDEVVVLSPGEGGLADELAAAGVAWRPLPMTREPSVADLRAIGRTRGVLRSFDLVHLHSSKGAAVGRLARLLGRGRARVVVLPHAWSWNVGGRLAPAYRLVERALLRLADVVVAVSDGERDAGRAVLGAAAPIRVIHNGVDVDRFRPAPVASSPRGDAVRVVVVGRLCRQKGQDRALRALALLPRRYELTLVGSGPDAEGLRVLARDLGVAGRARFVGAADPLPHLQAADLALVPSRWEGLSLSMLEAMACGLPVVVTAVAGSEVVGPDVGVVVPADAAPDVIAAAVAGLGDDPAARAATGAAARELAVARFATRSMLDAYAALWDELAPRR